MKWGVCSGCDAFGEAPPEFDERRHFLQCTSCLAIAFLTHSDPRESGYTKTVRLTTVNHGEAL